MTSDTALGEPSAKTVDEGPPCDDDPLIVSTKDARYELTDTKGGVQFDLNGDGEPEQIPWIAGKDDAFLALDRNGNGLIDDGRELFSHASPRPEVPGGIPNGFPALRMFDDPLNGGNNDGRINSSDEIYGSLRCGLTLTAMEVRTLASWSRCPLSGWPRLS